MSEIQGSINDTQSYALISSYGIYDRDIHQHLFKKVPRASALSWMRAVQGRMTKRRAKRHSYSFYEEGQFFKASATIATATPDSGNVTIAISAADHSDSGTKSFPIPKMLVVFEDETVGYIDTVDKTTPGKDDAHEVHVIPLNSSQDVNTAAVVGSTITFFSNAQGEKSIETQSRVPKVSKVTNKIHTFRDMFEVTDHESQNEVEFEYNGSKFLYVKGIDDTADSFALQEELGCLLSVEDDGSITDPDTTNTVNTMKGLIPQISDSGKTAEYFNSPDMTTFDDVILLLNKNFGDTEYLVGQGLDVNLKLKNWFMDMGQGGAGNISYSVFDGQEQAIKLNFKSVFIEPYSFHFQTWQILSHSDSLGAGNMPYRDMMIFMPTGVTKNPDVQVNTGEKEYEPYIQLVYSDPGGNPMENRGDYRIFETGALARDGAKDDEATRKIHFLSYKGIEIRCRNKFVLLRKG